MTPLTIPAQIVNGQLQLDRTLSELEGQRVIVTVTSVTSDSQSGTIEKVAPPESTEDIDVEPPEWLQVENDVYFPMDVPSISLGKLKIIVSRGEPSGIVPEELPDD